MPTFTDLELSQAIERGDIGAVTLDTNVFDGSDCNLTYALFKSLGQFAGTGTTYLLTDVVCGEVRAHIAERAKAAAIKLKAAARECREAFRVAGMQPRILAAAGDIDDPKQTAHDQLDAYRAATRFTELKSTEHVTVATLLQQYFDESAPFEAKSEKKSEFPDAIALNALEAWGEAQKKLVLAIAKDKGWARFAAKSKWVVCRGDLRASLGAFHAEDGFLAKALIDKVNAGEAAPLAEEITEQVAGFVEGLNPVIEAETAYPYTDELLAVTLLERSDIDVDSVVTLRSTDEAVLIGFDIEVLIEVEASFTFYVSDEGDDIAIGSTERSRTFELKLPATATVTRDLENVQVQEVELQEPRYASLNFGMVEPDHGDAEYDDEDWG
jgi:hypothetical protein